MDRKNYFSSMSQLRFRSMPRCIQGLVYAILILIFASCSPTKKSRSVSITQTDNFKLIDSTNIYRITKIDSIENIYVLYAQKNKLIYKIVSIHDSVKCIKNIEIGNFYNLSLRSVFPPNYLQKDRVSFVRYGSVNIPVGGEKEMVWDLFSVENLKGLCLY